MFTAVTKFRRVAGWGEAEHRLRLKMVPVGLARPYEVTRERPAGPKDPSLGALAETAVCLPTSSFPARPGSPVSCVHGNLDQVLATPWSSSWSRVPMSLSFGKWKRRKINSQFSGNFQTRNCGALLISSFSSLPPSWGLEHSCRYFRQWD